ncbi:MAG: iron complex outermembrane receptor protein [Cryomorphaceae bacterium]|jgi:iron complex outermembrane receptor protein
MNPMKPIATALSLAIYSYGALGQTPMLEEVIVTATKRAENLQDIPLAVNAFSSDTIHEAGINDTSDLAIMTPSLNANANSSPFTTRLTIRGIGTAQADPALEPSVGMFVDGVFMSRSGLGTSDLTDIERIEVLQGPQGTLYGKNANAGAISIITKRPNFDEFEGYVEASAGNYGMGKLTATVSGPIGDTVAYRLSGNIHQRDGYYDNAGTGVDDQNDADDWNLQGKLQWQPTDRLSMLLSAAHVERDTTCCGADSTQGDTVQQKLIDQGLSPDNNDPYNYKVATDRPEAFTMESDLVSLHIDYDMHWGSITFITGWNNYEYSTSLDADRSQLDLLYLSNEHNEGDSFSQELRLDASLGDNIDYQVGLFYYEQTTQRGDGTPIVFIGEDFITIADQQGLPLPFPTVALVAQPGDYLTSLNIWDTRTLALFGQATWHIGDRWHLTGGLRWTDEEREAELFAESFSTAPLAAVISFLDIVSTPIDTTLDRSSDNVDWLTKLAYDIGESSMIYASVSTGSKSGNFNGVNGEPDEREFDDETTTSYELGLKATVLDSTLRINAAAFYTEIEDYQFQDQMEVGIGTTVSNDGKVEVSGIDIQLDALPLPNLTLTAGLLYMYDYEITAGPREGQELPYTAEFSGNIGATLVFPLAGGGLYIRGDYIFMDDHITNGGNADQLKDKDIDDRELLNMKIGWRNDNWNISLWGKNLTEDEYATQTTITQLFSGQDSYFLAPPRTYGATLRYDF